MLWLRCAEEEAYRYPPLVLAYVGDAVHDLMVRTGLAFSGESVRSMHGAATREVNAAAQAEGLGRIEGMLTEEEADVVRRGRNAHAHHGVPKRVKALDYARATGLEALFGFLYLTGRIDRLKMLYIAMRREA